MSQYYKPNRNSKWNYGGPNWTLSRGKIDLFCECARCFYVDNKLGVARPPGFPFNINSAVDALLKKELDTHRAHGTQHPLAKAYGLDAVPFAHAKMDEWRNALSQGVMYFHEPTQMTVRGGVDDIWVSPQGELIVIDYKATSKDKRIESLDEEWHRGYKRQIEVYQWLLRRNGFTVSGMGYWFYANASKDREAFDGRLDFELTLVPYQGDDSWVEPVLFKIKECLESSNLPMAGEDCDYCRYREAADAAISRLLPPARALRAARPSPTLASREKPLKSNTTHEKETNTAQLF